MKKKQCDSLLHTYVHKCPKMQTHACKYQAQEQAHKLQTWVAWRSSVLPLSAPSQTLCNAPAGRGPTVCACRCDHTGPKRGTTHRNTCFYTCTCTQTPEASVETQCSLKVCGSVLALWSCKVKVQDGYISAGLVHSPNQDNATWHWTNHMHNDTEETFQGQTWP